MNSDFSLQGLPDQGGRTIFPRRLVTGSEFIQIKGYGAGDIPGGCLLLGLPGSSRLVFLVPAPFQAFLEIEQGFPGERGGSKVKFQGKSGGNPRDQAVDHHGFPVVQGAEQMSHLEILAHPCQPKLLDINKAAGLLIQEPTQIRGFKLAAEGNLVGV